MGSNWFAGIVLIMSALLIASAAAVPSSAHPPSDTDHGIPERIFHKLWSGDSDGATSGENLSSGGGTAMEELANGTDIPLDSPPRAVEQWNQGDHREFPDTNRSISIHPPDANLSSERFVKDAYAEVFAVQPSTRTRLSPSRQPLYAASNGTLRGTVDYRVSVPPDDTSGDRRVYWSLESHEISETRVLVDGDEENSARGNHIPALSYSLDGYAGQEHQLTLQANISVTLRKKVRVCTAHNNESDCTNWQTSTYFPVENVTVSDSIDVTTYDLAVSGFIARYPNGDLGLVVYKNQPWLGYKLPNGDVRGVWRFYSARDEDWDTLVYSSDSGERTAQSPLHPLQVNAYPIETGPTPSPRRNVTILDVYGISTQPPSLPPNVHLDILTESYTASYGIATRAKTNKSLSTVKAWGLVRGVSAERSSTDFARIQINESNLTIAVLNKSESTVTVQIQLRDANTGNPINTAGRDGYIVLDDRRLNTTTNGTVTVTLNRPPGGISARYEPGLWWLNLPGYTGDSDTVLVQGSALAVVSTLFRLGVPVSLFLLAVFLIDRLTVQRIWPPWRKL